MWDSGNNTTTKNVESRAAMVGMLIRLLRDTWTFQYLFGYYCTSTLSREIKKRGEFQIKLKRNACLFTSRDSNQEIGTKYGPLDILRT